MGGAAGDIDCSMYNDICMLNFAIAMYHAQVPCPCRLRYVHKSHMLNIAYTYVPIHPHALGEDIDVPCMSLFFFNVHVGTEAMAPPGAVIHTPRSPSVL